MCRFYHTDGMRGVGIHHKVENMEKLGGEFDIMKNICHS